MQRLSLHTLVPLARVLAAVLIVKVTLAVVAGYVNYFPPDFNSDFLRGREGYFFGGYKWVFYAHIVAGPPALVSGLLLMSRRLRTRFPRWHRRIGRGHALAVLLVLVPSGLWMAFRAAGPVSVVSFVTLSLLTGSCVALGWRAAVQRRFASHQLWMTRTFVLLCSAVVLRVAGGMAVVLGVTAEWYDPLASWACWVAPLAVFELSRVLGPTRASQRPIVAPRRSVTRGIGGLTPTARQT